MNDGNFFFFDTRGQFGLKHRKMVPFVDLDTGEMESSREMESSGEVSSGRATSLESS
jgi:hypothetical protein